VPRAGPCAHRRDQTGARSMASAAAASALPLFLDGRCLPLAAGPDGGRCEIGAAFRARRAWPKAGCQRQRKTAPAPRFAARWLNPDSALGHGEQARHRPRRSGQSQVVWCLAGNPKPAAGTANRFRFSGSGHLTGARKARVVQAEPSGQLNFRPEKDGVGEALHREARRWPARAPIAAGPGRRAAATGSGRSGQLLQNRPSPASSPAAPLRRPVQGMIGAEGHLNLGCWLEGVRCRLKALFPGPDAQPGAVLESCLQGRHPQTLMRKLLGARLPDPASKTQSAATLQRLPSRAIATQGRSSEAASSNKVNRRCQSTGQCPRSSARPATVPKAAQGCTSPASLPQALVK